MTYRELEARFRLNYANDPSGVSAREELVRALLNEAQDELSQELARRSVSALRQGEALSEAVPGADTLDAPAELLRPLLLLARRDGSPDDWEVVPQRDAADPNATPDPGLRWWIWRNATVRHSPVTVRHELLIRYYRSLRRFASDPNDGIGPDAGIELPAAANYLCRKAGELYFAQVKKDPGQASYCRQVAAEAFNTLAANLTRDQQGRPLRRPAIRFGGRARVGPFYPSRRSLLR